MKKVLLLSSLLAMLATVSQTTVAQEKTMDEKQNKFSPLDIATIERVTGKKGKENHGEYKITIPQNDLNVEVDGFKIIPSMGLGAWAAFTPSAEGAMVMGDIILTENDLKPVQQEAIRQGLTISAIHNHFVRNHPNIIYMHVGGSGTTEQMAQKIKAVFDAVKTSRGHDPAAAPADSVVTTIDSKMLDGIIGSKANGLKVFTNTPSADRM
jgi:hypothetical protein